jgi:hypothetical protein
MAEGNISTFMPNSRDVCKFPKPCIASNSGAYATLVTATARSGTSRAGISITSSHTLSAAGDGKCPFSSRLYQSANPVRSQYRHLTFAESWPTNTNRLPEAGCCASGGSQIQQSVDRLAYVDRPPICRLGRHRRSAPYNAKLSAHGAHNAPSMHAAQFDANGRDC